MTIEDFIDKHGKEIVPQMLRNLVRNPDIATDIKAVMTLQEIARDFEKVMNEYE